MNKLLLYMGAVLLLGSCNMVTQVQRSTSAIKENQRAVTAATYGIEQNLETVERSSYAIEQNLEVVEDSTRLIRENAVAVESSTAVIRRNAEVVERSTELLGKMDVSPRMMKTVVIGGLILLFGLPFAIVAYLAQINYKMKKFLKEYKKNRTL